MEQKRSTFLRMTQFMHDVATSPSMPIDMAVDFLKHDARIRTIRETLFRYARVPSEDLGDLRSFLTEEIFKQSKPGTKKDAIDRKVRMWLNNDVQSVSKQGAIQLSFVFALSPEDANEFLFRTCGEGFHWRSPEDLVYIYALKQKMTYPQALDLRDDMKKDRLLEPGNGDGSTVLVRQKFDQLSDEKELEDFLRQFQGQLGDLHNTAYGFFTKYLELLRKPEFDYLPKPDKDEPRNPKKNKKEEEKKQLVEPEREFSVREVTAAYLHDALIPRIKKHTKGNAEAEKRILSALQRDIQQNWPNETTLYRMIHRETDVTRKVLILLFLATDGAVSYDGIDEDFLEEEEDFESRSARLNIMLSSCGFAPLDSRSPFDWMILYCMCIEEVMFIDARLEAFLEHVFPPSPPESEEL